MDALKGWERDEEWGTDGKGRGAAPAGDPVGPPGDDELRRLARPGTRRDDPRRHTLSSGHHQSASIARSMDLESPLPRGYPPPSSAMLYDDDPGIMSEAEPVVDGIPPRREAEVLAAGRPHSVEDAGETVRPCVPAVSE
ncbi:UNVERIFIED_CONTAM: hypothetical protein PYX00_004666 [Menopon gallinae]|uniref:Uncharacterized protein n=1 Tax=Menopon gallinae TaxID=328185 RepID=A0AAW2I5A1_9NEOP